MWRCYKLSPYRSSYHLKLWFSGEGGEVDFFAGDLVDGGLGGGANQAHGILLGETLERGEGAAGIGGYPSEPSDVLKTSDGDGDGILKISNDIVNVITDV